MIRPTLDTAKERPILFSGPMVCAILEGRKTQTRRLLTLGNHKLVENVMDLCPYGHPGDRLWVRETTRQSPLPNLLTGEPTSAMCGVYVADGEPVLDERGFDYAWWYSRPVCPTIHMPRWACRLALEVKAVRVEHLQEISREDEIAEGCPDGTHFDMLWDSINGKRSPWQSNPWVWVIEFRRTKESAMAIAA